MASSNADEPVEHERSKFAHFHQVLVELSQLKQDGGEGFVEQHIATSYFRVSSKAKPIQWHSRYSAAAKGWETIEWNAFNDDVDVPCRNDVDPAGEIRSIVFVLSLLIAAISISPAF